MGFGEGYVDCALKVTQNCEQIEVVMAKIEEFQENPQLFQ
jgi:hypothetical protein